jgi:hypothetical protein
MSDPPTMIHLVLLAFLLLFFATSVWLKCKRQSNTPSRRGALML